MDREDIIDLINVKPKQYDKFFLNRNPFPAIGIPGVETPFTVDREEIIRKFADAVTKLRIDGKGSLTVLVGDYGSGKSHLLTVFKQNVMNQLLSRENGTLAIYIKSPGEELLDLYFGLIEDIGRPLLKKYSEEIIQEYIRNHRREYLATVKEIADKNYLGEHTDWTDYSIGDLLSKCRCYSLYEGIKKERFSNLKSNDLIMAFFNLAHPDYSWKAWRWFLGDPLEKIDRTQLHIDSSINSSEGAYDLISEIFNLLKTIGIESIVLLIDELENTVTIHPSKRIKYQEFLRRLIDDFANKVCIYFTIAIHQWGVLSNETTALKRRLTSNFSKLENFTMDYTRKMIEKYLFYARTDDFSAKEALARFTDCEPSLCPFTTESIEEIQKITIGRVSIIIQFCSHCLEYYYEHQNEFSSITPELVKKVRIKESYD